MKDGRPLSPPPPHPYDPDYIHAADRHIKICKEQHARMPNNGKPGEASTRIPQRSGVRQQSGTPSSKASSAGSVRSAGLTSPPSGAANKPQRGLRRSR
uniref:Uncharacterized protein n=1 Tax=Gouania willdenowi TaxID=441366 RepID=A0A8C5NHA0_GOUWI